MEKKKERDWSGYQKNIFKNVQTGKGHVIINAVAGSGKTTTLVEAVKYVPKKSKILFVAFNKSIATELESRISKSYVECSTLHSLGFKTIRACFGNSVSLDLGKTFKIIRSLLPAKEEKNYDLIFTIDRVVSLCKAHWVDTPIKISEIIDDFSVDLGEYTEEQFIKVVVQTLAESKKDKLTVNFDDMIYLCAVYSLPVKKYDYVFVDEVQDLNTTQTYLIYSACNKGGRIISCGDPYQAIYRFRGADSDSIANIQKKLNAEILPLSISYRCAKNIVKEAQTIVPYLEHHPLAPAGEVSSIPERSFLERVRPGDFVLSRTNAPLIKYCLRLLKMGIRANIQGRDVGEDLKFLIKKSKKRSLPEFNKWLENWSKEELLRFASKNKDASIITDKVLCLETLSEESKSVDDLKHKIDSLFNDEDDRKIVIFSSTHRAKGLERDRVFIIRHTYKPGFSREESNLLYVAITRAKRELFFVEKKLNLEEEEIPPQL